MKKQMTKKEQVIVAGIIVICLVSALIFMFLLQPLVKTMIDNSKQAKAIEANLLNAENMTADKEKLSQEVKLIAEKIAYYEKKLPSQMDIPQILDNLIKIGKKSKVVFISIEPQDVEEIFIGDSEEKSYLEIPIEMKLLSGYHEFAEFVNGIEGFQRFMKVDNIRISTDKSNPIKQNIELTVSAYALESDKKDEKNQNQ